MPIAARRIAIYVLALIDGGAERVAAVLATGLSRAGQKVTLIVDFESSENRSLVAPEVELITLGSGHCRSIMRLSRELAERRFDVVLAIGCAADVKLAAAHLLSRSSARLVLSYHGVSTIARRLLGWSAYPLAPLLTRYASRTVCVSDHLVNHMVRRWRSSPRRVVRIYNPVPVDCAKPAASATELAARSPTILALGRLAAEKDFATLIRAFAVLRRKHCRLVILGEGPERSSLLRLAQELGVSERVKLPGYINDPWNAYAGAACLVLCSKSEAFGNVVVEALASGLPVVATDCGGPTEILELGRHGEIVSVGQPAQLAAAIERALDRPGDPGPRATRAGEFATDKIAGQYLALFDEVLAGTRTMVREAPHTVDVSLRQS
jgi:glycosyltransferase involved in cell wall biosynthesis